MEELKLQNEEYIHEVVSLKKQLEQVKSSTVADQQVMSRDQKRDESAEMRASHLSLDFISNKSILERQEGEVGTAHARKVNICMVHYSLFFDVLSCLWFLISHCRKKVWPITVLIFLLQ